MQASGDNLDDPAMRLGDPADLDELARLLRDCVQEMQGRGLDQWDDVYPDRAVLQADLGGRVLYVASRGGGPLAGAFTMNQHQDPEYAEVAWQIQSAPVAVVHRLMVHPTCQRAGLGRALMRFAERQAHHLGFRAIRLDTLIDNARALAFYRGLGYRDAGRVRFRKGLFACLEKAVVAPAEADLGVTLG